MKMHVVKIITLGLLLTIANSSVMKAEPKESDKSIAIEENQSPEAEKKCLSFEGSCLVP